MFEQLNCIAIDQDEANGRELSSFLGRFGVSVTGQFRSVDGLADILGRPDAPQMVIINMDPAPYDVLKRIGDLPRKFDKVAFVVLSATVDANLILESMHAGIRDFLTIPVDEQKLGAAVERVASRHGMGKKATIISVVPTIGGCGSTTIACNLAASLARTHRTALADLDLIRGGCASYFDARPRYTISDVADSTATVDPQMVRNSLILHEASQCAILARPDQPEDALRVDAPGLARLAGVMGRMFDFVVFDSVMSIDPLYKASIEASDLNLIVMQLNVPSAKNAERYVGALRRMGVDSGKIKVVVNRYVKKGWDIEPEEVERTLGLKLNWMIPNDYKNAIAAVNFGEPVVLRAPKSEMAEALFELAGAFTSQQPVPLRKAA